MFVVVAAELRASPPAKLFVVARDLGLWVWLPVPSNANATTVSFIHGYVEMLDFIAEEICVGPIRLRLVRAVICSGRTKQFMIPLQKSYFEVRKKSGDRHASVSAAASPTNHNQPEMPANRAKASSVCVRIVRRIVLLEPKRSQSDAHALKLKQWRCQGSSWILGLFV